MQEATTRSVLGDFSGVTAEGSRFFERDGVAVVAADGAEHEVAYAFGAAPLQQYLLRLPRGRLQAFGTAWDAEAGRWYALYPEERPAPGDPLHWTGRDQTWNFMCADCHSTGLRKSYDPQTDSYETTWEEIDVACEACHGPGSRHAEDPARPLPVRFPPRGEWAFANGAPIAQRTESPGAPAELETCAACHARRSSLVARSSPGERFADRFRLALLEPGLYHADGTIDGEVYEYGSFLQSRMAHAGVTCSDCHDPHGLELRAEGAAVCATCHRPAVYDVGAHHHHPTAVTCVDCHMPSVRYMGIDVRHDHSFRVPNPALSAEIGAPDPCTSCHTGESAAWAARTMREWYGEARPAPVARALHAARSGRAEAPALLEEVIADPTYPAITRASAIEAHPTAPEALLDAAAGDRDPLVRAAAARATRSPELLAILARDPRRSVRLDAARRASELDPSAATLGFDELRASLRANEDRPESRLSLGLLEARLGHESAAERAYRGALDIAPDFVPAMVNLADLSRLRGDEETCATWLERATATDPTNAPARHALGLSFVRRGQPARAVAELAAASELDPDHARYAFVLAVALADFGEPERAREVVRKARTLHPGDPGLAALADRFGS